MADSPQEPRRFPTAPPGAPLPRIWKLDPEPEEDDPVAARKKKKDEEAQKEPPPPPKPKKKKTDKDKKKTTSDGGKKGVLVEETPALDTYEARQRARIIGGVALAVICGLCMLLLYRSLSHSEPIIEDRPPPDEPGAHLPPPAPPDQSGPKREEEALALFERARVISANGDTALALTLLVKVKTLYPKTRAAASAAAALERSSQKQPLFTDRAPLAAATKSGTSAAPPAPAPTAAIPKPALGPHGEPNLPPPPSSTSNPSTPALAANTSTSPAAPATPPVVVKKLPDGFHAREGAATHPSGWPREIVGDHDDAPMVLVPGGTFTIGRDDGESAEGPPHKVMLGTFYIDQHEVTNRQFDQFVKEAGPRRDRERALVKEREKEKETGADHGSDSDDAPVVLVSARDAKDYADWADKALPTEAQWEAAARSTDGRLYPWGHQPLEGDNASRKTRHVKPVRSFPEDVSPCGAFDLAGNAWEWTKDWYDPKYYQQLKSSVADNPTGPPRPKSEQLVVRGGAKNWVVTHREGIKWSTRLPYLGFRCVLQVEGPGNVFEPKPAPAAPGARPAPGGPVNNQGVVPF